MKKLFRVILSLICLAIVLSAPFLIKNEKPTESQKSVILTIWHVDSFEGGKGSRYTFLRNVSTLFSKQNENVYLLVTSFSTKGIETALAQGKTPDLISFGGVGLELKNRAKEIYESVKDGGDINGKRYAVSYLKGGYFKIQKGNGENIILSKGENTSPEIAYLFSGINSKNVAVLPTGEAYSRFLREKNATLIGTQRDVYRLTNQEVEFTATPIEDFNDLYQYIALTSKEDKNEFYARRFIKFLLSDEVQKKVSSLGMLSVNLKGNGYDNEYLSALEKVDVNFTVSPFSSRENFNLACENSIKAIENGGGREEVSNFLKEL